MGGENRNKIVINLNNNYASINYSKNYHNETIQGLRKVLSFKDSSSAYRRIGGRIQFMKDKVKTYKFYSLDTDSKEIIMSYGCIDVLRNSKEFKDDFDDKFEIQNECESLKDLIPKNFSIEKVKNIFKDYGKPLRETQITFFKKIIEDDYYNFMVKAPTGAGKTILFLALAKLLNVPTLFVNFSQTICKKNYEVAKSLGFEDTGFYTGSKKSEDKFFQFCTVGKLNNLPNQEKYKIMIIDEAHECASDTYQKILLKYGNIKHYIGFSATPLKQGNNLQKIKVQSVFGKVMELEDMNTLINKKVLVKPKFYIFENNDKEVRDNFYKEGNPNDIHNLQSIGYLHNKSRNETAIKIIRKRYDKNGRILVLTKLIEHGNIIHDLLKEEGIPCKFVSGEESLKTREEAMDDFIKQGGKEVLILSSIGDVGIDLPNMTDLVLLSGGKAHWLTEQRLGRSTRSHKGKNHVNVYDFYDLNHKILENWSNERIKVYKKIKDAEVKIVRGN